MVLLPVHLRDDGTFLVGLDSEAAEDEFYEDYPDLLAAEEEQATLIDREGIVTENGVRIRSQGEKDLMDRRERTRLTAL